MNRPSLTPSQLELLRQLAIPNGRTPPAGYEGKRPWSRRRVYKSLRGEYLVELAADIVEHRRRAFDRADVAVLFRAGLTIATIPGAECDGYYISDDGLAFVRSLAGERAA